MRYALCVLLPSLSLILSLPSTSVFLFYLFVLCVGYFFLKRARIGLFLELPLTKLLQKITRDKIMQDYIRIEKAIKYIEDNFQNQPSLEEVAECMHLSPFHAQRLFRGGSNVSMPHVLRSEEPDGKRCGYDASIQRYDGSHRIEKNGKKSGFDRTGHLCQGGAVRIYFRL